MLPANQPAKKCGDQQLGWTYHRFNNVLKCEEYLGYGGEAKTMNQECFVKNRYKSALFDERPVLSLNKVYWMNPHTQFENVPISEDARVVHVYVCHSYE